MSYLDSNTEAELLLKIRQMQYQVQCVFSEKVRLVAEAVRTSIYALWQKATCDLVSKLTAPS